jgi:hypothetical protein
LLKAVLGRLNPFRMESSRAERPGSAHPRSCPAPAAGHPAAGAGQPECADRRLLAWRGVPAAAAAAIQAAKATSDAALQVAQAATVAAAGTPGAPAAIAAEETAKNAAGASMGSMITGAAGGADIHICLTPLGHCRCRRMGPASSSTARRPC